MANPIYEFDPVTHITAGAVGKPGHRVFYVQAERGLDRITMQCEKQQVQALADAIDEMVAKLEEDFGLARGVEAHLDEIAMAIREPVDPLFRVGAMGLGYDANRDRILLVVQEALPEEEERDPLEVRLFASRAQMQMLSTHARAVAQRGRSPEQVAMQANVHARRNGHGE